MIRRRVCVLSPPTRSEHMYRHSEMTPETDCERRKCAQDKSAISTFRLIGHDGLIVKYFKIKEARLRFTSILIKTFLFWTLEGKQRLHCLCSKPCRYDLTPGVRYIFYDIAVWRIGALNHSDERFSALLKFAPGVQAPLASPVAQLCLYPLHVTDYGRVRTVSRLISTELPCVDVW